MITVLIDGQERTDFTSASVTKSIETFAGTFVLQMTETKNIHFPMKVGASCQILIDGKQVINGYIEKLAVKYDAETHSIRVAGRDRTGDIIDSTVGESGTNQFKNLTLTQITENILKKYNLTHIKVIDEVGTKPFTTDNISVDYGSTVFELLEKYAQKRQVLLTVNGSGNIVYTRSPRKEYKTQILIAPDAPSEALTCNFVIDLSKRFNKYNCKSGADASNMQNYTTIPPKKLAGTSDTGMIIDEGIRNSRIYNFQPSAVTEGETLKDRAKWEANFRKSQSAQWSYTLSGHTAKDDKDIWRPGYFVNVVDDFINLKSRLLISGVTYTESLSEGSKTTMKLLPDNAFSLEIEKQSQQKQSTDEGVQQYTTIPKLQAKKQVTGVRGQTK